MFLISQVSVKFRISLSLKFLTNLGIYLQICMYLVILTRFLVYLTF